MKRVLFLLTAAGLVLSASSDIRSTKHNLSSSGMLYATGGATTETQICKFCHTPHGAQAYIGASKFVPLWGRTTTSSTTFGTLTADNGAGSTFACLSCHDGTVAITNNNAVTTADADIAALGGINDTVRFTSEGKLLNAKNDPAATHPVNKPLGSYTNIKGVVDPSITTFGTNKPKLFPGSTAGVTVGFTDTPQAGDATKTYKLYSSYYIQCSSCHAVHGPSNPVVVTGAAYASKNLLRVTTDGSALCLSCHTK